MHVPNAISTRKIDSDSYELLSMMVLQNDTTRARIASSPGVLSDRCFRHDEIFRSSVATANRMFLLLDKMKASVDAIMLHGKFSFSRYLHIIELRQGKSVQTYIPY
jgi:hypothetical protein